MLDQVSALGNSNKSPKAKARSEMDVSSCEVFSQDIVLLAQSDVYPLQVQEIWGFPFGQGLQ